MPKYTKGKFPFTVLDTTSGKLYVRKSVALNKFVRNERTGRVRFAPQKQIWRLCEPATGERVLEVLFEIETELSGGNLNEQKEREIFSRIEQKFRRNLK